MKIELTSSINTTTIKLLVVAPGASVRFSWEYDVPSELGIWTLADDIDVQRSYLADASFPCIPVILWSCILSAKSLDLGNIYNERRTHQSSRWLNWRHRTWRIQAILRAADVCSDSI